MKIWNLIHEYIRNHIWRKYEGVMIPTFLPEYNMWIVDTEFLQKYRVYLRRESFKKKWKKELRWHWLQRAFFVMPGGPEAGDIEWVMSEFAGTGLFYRFWDANSRKYNHFEHEHSFEGVLYALENDLENFSIEGFEEDYSKQQINFIQAIRDRYTEISSEK